MKINDLINSGLLKIAEMPPDNPKEWEEKNWTIFLIEHEYPGKSPRLWNTVYSELGWPFRTAMLVGEPAKISEIFSVFRKDSTYLGGGLGIGFKDEAVKRKALDFLDESAKLVQAVNVVTKREKKLIGHNTDGVGFLKSLEEKFLSMKKELSSAHVMILGAGGTANAIAFALAPKVKSIFILNRTESKAEELAERINSFMKKQKAIPGGEEKIAKLAPRIQVIINTSIKGATGKFADYFALATTDSLEKNLRDSESIFKSLRKETLISDINLTATEPATLKLAKSFGLPTLNGKPMVVFQAIEAFYLVHSDLLKKKNITKEKIGIIMQGLSL